MDAGKAGGRQACRDYFGREKERLEQLVELVAEVRDRRRQEKYRVDFIKIYVDEAG